MDRISWYKIFSVYFDDIYARPVESSALSVLPERAERILGVSWQSHLVQIWK